MTRLRNASLILFAAGMAMAGTAGAVAVTNQSASSQVDALGTTQLRQDVSQTDGFASSVAIWPPGFVDAQARTAARSRAAEIAANARVFSDSFARLNVDLALSQAYYAIHLDPVLVDTRTSLEFFLPPSYLEFVTNAETSFNELTASFFADLRVCQQASCSIADRVFYFQVDGHGQQTDMRHSVMAFGDPALDFTSLLDPVVSDSGDGFVRTYLVEFPDFTGQLDLGLLAASTPLTLEYVLQARTAGTAQFSSAIAAINDPFALDGDPVLPGAALLPSVTAVPLPASWLALLPALLALPSRRRQRRGRAAASL